MQTKKELFIDFDGTIVNSVKSIVSYKVCFGDVYPWNEDWKGERSYNWMDIKDSIRKLDFL